MTGFLLFADRTFLFHREQQRSLGCARDDIRGETLSHIRFHAALGIHPAPLARPFSKGLLSW